MDRPTEKENQKTGQSRAFGGEQTPEGVTTPFSVILRRPDATFVATGVATLRKATGRDPIQDWRGLLDDFRNYLRSEECSKAGQLMGSVT